MSKKCYLEFDGSSKGYPGKSGGGAVLRREDGSLICRTREGLGNTTNNDAEYRGLIRGLDTAIKKGYDSIHVRGDSKLVCDQLQDECKVKNPNLARRHDEATRLKSQFKDFQMEHVRREYNREADAEANEAVNLPPGQIYEESDDDY